MPHTIRAYRPSDAAALSRLRYRAVRELAPIAYTPEQIAAWLPEPQSVAAVRARCEDGRRVWVCIDADDTLMGYTDLEADGHVDTLYTHPDFARRGVGTALLAHVETIARADGLARLFSEASALAVGVFERAGFVRLERREFELRGVAIYNFAVEKLLGAPGCSPDHL